MTGPSPAAPRFIKRSMASSLLAALLLSGLGAAQTHAADVTIGISTPQSGGGADYGTAFINGIKLALKDLNGEVGVGGQKVKLKLSICDDEFKSDKAANCARKLASQDGAKFMFNAGTYATVPMLSFNQDAGFLLVGASGDPAVTTRGNKLYVRTWANVVRTMPGFVDSLLAHSKANGVSVDKVALMEVNTDLGAAWIGNFRKEWERRNKEIVGRVVYDQNGTDFYSQLTPLLSKKPDLIVLTTICEPTALVVKQARELRYAGTFLNHAGCTGAQLLKLAPAKDVEGMIFESAPWTREAPETSDFRKRYLAAYGMDPQLISAVGYLDMMWLARSMETAGTATDPKAVRAAMPAALNRMQPNILGWGNLDANGDIDWPMHVTFIRNGATVQGAAGK